MIRLTRPTASALEAVRQTHENDAFTYTEVGATASEIPDGWHVLRQRVRLGDAGGDTFAKARTFLRDWGIQRGSGLSIASSGPVAVGATVAQAAPMPVAGFILATCRVVYVEDTEDRYAYAYGTLGLHPEVGEEYFAVHRQGTGVYLDITAFSKAGPWFVRAAGPLAWVIQRQATTRYVRAVQRAVTD